MPSYSLCISSSRSRLTHKSLKHTSLTQLQWMACDEIPLLNLFIFIKPVILSEFVEEQVFVSGRHTDLVCCYHLSLTSLSLVDWVVQAERLHLLRKSLSGGDLPFILADCHDVVIQDCQHVTSRQIFDGIDLPTTSLASFVHRLQDALYGRALFGFKGLLLFSSRGDS